MNQLNPGARAEIGLMTTRILSEARSACLWHAVRLLVLTFLAILEPVVRFILGALALPGQLIAVEDRVGSVGGSSIAL